MKIANQSFPKLAGRFIDCAKDKKLAQKISGAKQKPTKSELGWFVVVFFSYLIICLFLVMTLCFRFHAKEFYSMVISSAPYFYILVVFGNSILTRN